MNRIRSNFLLAIRTCCQSAIAGIRLRVKATVTAIAVTALLAIGPQALAGPLIDRAKAGGPIRIAFIAAMPWCGQNEKGEAVGFANKITIGSLKKMGFPNIQPVLLADWAGLIPGLMAVQFDIISCGMYIDKERCKNVAFSDPMGDFKDPFIVPKGNPKKLRNWSDIKASGVKMVTVTGFSNIDQALRFGIKPENIMKVPSRNEVLAAMMADRADVAPYTYFEAIGMVAQSGGKLEMTDMNEMEEWSHNWGANAFRKEDKDFVELFNVAQKQYLGSPAMMAAVADDLYTQEFLPNGQHDVEWICANR
jgi:polar amino acid transport system substrate-binding protein